jgi:hypothetical protein
MTGNAQILVLDKTRLTKKKQTNKQNTLGGVKLNHPTQPSHGHSGYCVFKESVTQVTQQST